MEYYSPIVPCVRSTGFLIFNCKELFRNYRKVEKEAVIPFAINGWRRGSTMAVAQRCHRLLL